MGTWPEETPGFICAKVIYFSGFVWNWRKGHADKKKLWIEKKKWENRGLFLAVIEWKINRLQLVLRTRTVVTARKHLFDEMKHIDPRVSDYRLNLILSQTQKQLFFFPWIKISVNVQVVCWKLQEQVKISCQEELLSISPKKIFSESVSILFNLYSIYILVLFQPIYATAD